VVAVTTRFKPSKTWAFERDAWLSELFGFNTDDDIIYTGAKELVYGDVFVDDKPDNIIKWKKRHPNGLAILFMYANTDVSAIPADLGHEVAHNWYDVMAHVNKRLPR
jgi:5'(3')-deoxyribonucleotidase